MSTNVDILNLHLESSAQNGSDSERVRNKSEQLTALNIPSFNSLL